MTDAMNLHNFPTAEGSGDARRHAAAAPQPADRDPRGDRPDHRDRRQRRPGRDRRPAARGAGRRPRSLDRHVGPGRQPDQDRLRPPLAARQRPQAQGNRCRGRPRHRRYRFPRRRRRTSRDRQADQFQARHHRLSDPGQQGLSGRRQRPQADVRRRRPRPYRDRHRLSDQGRARRALCRCPARQAFRPAGLDRHRQIDRRPRSSCTGSAIFRPKAIS